MLHAIILSRDDFFRASFGFLTSEKEKKGGGSCCRPHVVYVQFIIALELRIHSPCIVNAIRSDVSEITEKEYNVFGIFISHRNYVQTQSK